MKNIIQQVKNQKLLKQLESLQQYNLQPYYLKPGNKSQLSKIQELKLQQGLNHAEQFYGEILKISEDKQIPEKNLFQLYWTWIFPFYQHLVQEKPENRPILLKCLGVPGVGKTAFGSIISKLSEFDNKKVVSLSTDDFYLEYEKRKVLQEQDERYIARGPPGTSDFQLLEQVIQNVRDNQKNIQVPEFDKSLHGGVGDRACFNTIESNIDIFILEGWYTGCQYIEPNDECMGVLNKITNGDKRQIEFALIQNELLKNYKNIWNKFDKQLVLTPENYRYMFDYRQEAERKLIKQKGSGLSEEKINQLMSYFYNTLCPEIYIENMIKSGQVDLLVQFDKQRNITNIEPYYINRFQ